MRYLLSIVLAFLAVGCASKGFNRGQLRDQIGVSKPEVSDGEIKEILKKKANLPKPFKLAVYFKRPPEIAGKPKWRWSEQDKDVFLEIAQDLKKDGLASDVYPILPSMVKNEDLRSLRLAAAQHGADALLVVDGAGEMDRYINGMGWSYFLLVTTFFVPGSEADSLFMTSAAMWDVRNEYLYLTAEAEGKAHDRYIAAFGDKDEVFYDKGKGESLKNLKRQLVDMIKGVKL